MFSHSTRLQAEPAEQEAAGEEAACRQNPTMRSDRKSKLAAARADEGSRSAIVTPYEIAAAVQRRSSSQQVFTPYLMPLTPYLMPLTPYLMPVTPYLMPLTPYLLHAECNGDLLACF